MFPYVSIFFCEICMCFWKLLFVCVFTYVSVCVYFFVFAYVSVFICVWFYFFVHLCMCGCGCVCVLSVRDYVYIYNNKWYQNISLLLLLHSLLSPQLSWLSPGHCRDLEQSYNSQLSEIGIMTGNIKWIFKIILVFGFGLINNCLRNYLWNE